MKHKLTVLNMLWVLCPLLSCALSDTAYALSMKKSIHQNVKDNQQKTVAILTKSEVQQFDTALKRLGEIGKITIIVEGYPLKTSLTSDEIPASSLQGSGFSKVLMDVASAYDYSVKQRKGVCILQKKIHSGRGFTLGDF